MKRVVFLLLVVFVFLHIAGAQSVNGEIRFDTANVTVVHVWGSHEERGYAYGYLLGEKVSDMVTGYMLPLFGQYMEEARTLVIEGKDIVFDSLFVFESMAVVEGMNDAGTNFANIDHIDVMVSNAYLDIAKLLGVSAGKPGCSSLMSWGDATTGTDLNGKSVISRHLDWSPHPTLLQNQVMVIHTPSEVDEQPWGMIGFAGQISVLSGFNANMAVFQHMMSDFTAASVHNQAYEPVWLTLRKAVERLDFNNDGQNNTMDLWDAVDTNPTGYADGYILTALAPSTTGYDSLTGLVAEVAPQEPHLTFRTNSYPDDIPGDNLYAANYEIKRNNHNHYCARYYAVMSALGSGTGIGSEENWEIMRDYSNALSGNIQFMQFIPEQDLFRITVHRDGLPAYMNPPLEFTISELLSYPVGMGPGPDADGLFLYPNPSGEFVVFDLPVHISKSGNDPLIRIFDVSGKEIAILPMTGERAVWDCREVQAGLYIYRCKVGGRPYSGKIVVRDN